MESAYNVPRSSAKMVAPSLFTMSGSSTPGSWLFVVEKETLPPDGDPAPLGAMAWGAALRTGGEGSARARGELTGTPPVIARWVRS